VGVSSTDTLVCARCDVKNPIQWELQVACVEVWAMWEIGVRYGVISLFWIHGAYGYVGHRQERLCYFFALDHGQSSALSTSPAFTGLVSM
jgi:hypothetical protein